MPKHWIKRNANTYRGQKQIWTCSGWWGAIPTFTCERAITRVRCLALEFYWVPLDALIRFKRG